MQKTDKKKIPNHYLLILVWIALFIVAGAWLLRPEPEIITPSGWKKWSQTGAIYTLIPYRNGVLAGGVKGLWYSDGNTTVAFAPSALPKGAMVTALAHAPGRGVWVGHSEGLSIFHKGEWWHWNIINGLPKPPIQSIILEHHKGGWIAGDNGLVRFSGDFSGLDVNKTRILPNHKYPIHRISQLLRDQNNDLWIGTNQAPQGGIFLLSGDKIRSWGHSDGLPHPQVTSIIQDSLGQIWVGTGFHNRGGAAIFKQTQKGWKLKKTLREDELAGPKVRSLAQDKQGRYWIGSESNGLTLRDDQKIITILSKEQGLPGKEVTHTIQTKDGAIWLATLKGLVRIDATALPLLLPVNRQSRRE